MKRIGLALAILFFGYSGCIIGGILFASFNLLPNIVSHIADYLESRANGEVPAGATSLVAGFVIGSVPGSLLGSLFGVYWAGEIGEFDVTFKWTFLGGIISPLIMLLVLPATLPGISLHYILIGLAIASLASPIGATIATVVTSYEINSKDGNE